MGMAGRTMTILILMGVSGSGKTTIAAELAKRLGWPMLEGDALHPPANIAKMSAGMPLTDEDAVVSVRTTPMPRIVIRIGS